MKYPGYISYLQREYDYSPHQMDQIYNYLHLKIPKTETKN